MPELVRNIANRLREFVGNRRRAARLRTQLLFTVSLVNTGASMGDAARRPASLTGHTRDLSSTGLALIVPAIRIGDRYLTGEDRRLLVVLELPSGPVRINATPVRYEQLEIEEAGLGYLIGVRITEMTDADRALFNDHLRTLR